jgi:hypothetical protein
MGNLFSSQKQVKPPPVPEPEPIPVLEEDVGETKKKKRPSRTETIITGELVPQTTKKTLLG